MSGHGVSVGDLAAAGRGHMAEHCQYLLLLVLSPMRLVYCNAY